MLHKPLFVEEEEEKGDSEVVWLNQRISSILFFSALCHLNLCNMLGEISNEWLLSLIILPHTYSCTYFIHQKVETNNNSTGFEHRGVYTLFNEKNEKCLKHQIFLYIYYYYYLYFFVFLGWKSGHDG